MRSFFVSIPPTDTPENVLLFLHGVGEAFIPVDKLHSNDSSETVKRLGVQNLFNHGVPKILSKAGELVCYDPKANPPFSLSFSLPVFKSFVIIAPQMFLREDMAELEKANEMMTLACGIARSVTRKAEPKIALMGFSRGGFAAFELAGGRREVSAIVTMDAVARGNRQELPVAKHETPFWAFYADYKDCDSGRADRITTPHKDLKAAEVEDFASAPEERRCKTLVLTDGSATERHNQVCNLVSNSTAVYEWILNRLRD
jgi:predicted peptidase